MMKKLIIPLVRTLIHKARKKTILWKGKLNQQGVLSNPLEERNLAVAASKAEKATNKAIESLQESLYQTQALTLLVASSQNLPLQDRLNESESLTYLRKAAIREDFFAAMPLIRFMPDIVNQLSLTQARTLMKGMRQLGYLEEATTLMRLIATKSGKESDSRRAALFRSEIELYSGSKVPHVQLPPFEGEKDAKTVLHFVGKALPETQSGYTLRTQYSVKAQSRTGIRPVVVRQAGATPQEESQTVHYSHDGISYFILGGPLRNTIMWDKWLVANIEGLAEVVRNVRPCILHAHSDFINAIIVQAVGDAYGIPVVNETRGFWEESWLSRRANTEGWTDLNQLERLYRLPSAYTLRKEREAEYRSYASVVVTLADVMKQHINLLASEYGRPVKEIAVVPNAVEVDKFPVMGRELALLRKYQIPEESTIIGYISSLVEYEGIDVLIKAFFELKITLGHSCEYSEAIKTELGASGEENHNDARHQAAIDRIATVLATLYPTLDAAERNLKAVELLRGISDGTARKVHLLIVGDGPEKRKLEDLVKDLDIAGEVTFTGRVPHDRVLNHYGLIDLFVVPRRPSSVTELVTPLKPFEAMSTGRPCIFSDVGALKEIANQSKAAVTFEAGNPHSLALTMASLIEDGQTLAQMAEKGAAWVRSARTWDSNAKAYLELYKTLGLAVDHTERES